MQVLCRVCKRVLTGTADLMPQSPSGMAAQFMTLGGSHTRAVKEVCIVGAVRTPFGSLMGSLSQLTACQLGSAAIQGALKQAGIPLEAVQEVYMGNVISAGLGQAPARQAALGAGLSHATVCTTVNKVCSSGMKSVMLGALSIQAGLNDVVVAGGMESMSNVPYYLERARQGYRMGHGQLVDGMIKDGLWDPYADVHMGSCAEKCAAEFGISRQQQDDHALETCRRAQAATKSGAVAAEIVAVRVQGRKGAPPTTVATDEAPSKMKPDRLRQLQPAFSAEQGTGTVTAGNASPITDGAAALVLVSGRKAAELGLKVLGIIRGQGDAEQAPDDFPTSPALAVPKALANAGLLQSQVDFWEINQAFSVVDLVNCRLLDLNPDSVNVHGGAVALGHPIGASGAAIIVRLLNVLSVHGGKVGVAAICNGGGGASSVVIERCAVLAESEGRDSLRG